MKKMIIILLVVVVLAGGVGAYFLIFSSDVTPAEDFNYELMEDDYILINRYIGDDKDVIIPNEIDGVPVKSVSPDAFYKTNVETVVLPDALQQLMYYAFFDCDELRSVEFGSELKEILGDCFKGCSKLEKVEFPSGLTRIYSYAFSDCESLKEITLPASLERVNTAVFYNSPISKVNFEEGLKKIPSQTCYWIGDTLTSVTIPDSVEELGTECFSKYLKEVHFLGNAPKTIGEKPFHEDTVIYYDEDASGWDDTPLSSYTLVAE